MIAVGILTMTTSIIIICILIILNLYRIKQFSITSFEKKDDILIIEISHRPYFWSFREAKSKYAAEGFPIIWHCVAGPSIRDVDVFVWGALESAWRRNEIKKSL